MPSAHKIKMEIEAEQTAQSNGPNRTGRVIELSLQAALQQVASLNRSIHEGFLSGLVA